MMLIRLCCEESSGPNGTLIDQAVFPCPEDKLRWRLSRASRLTTCAHCSYVLRGIDVSYDDGRSSSGIGMEETKCGGE